MGEFLAIGLVTTLYANTTAVAKAGLTRADLEEQMNRQTGFTPEIYDCTENEKSIQWKLRDTVLAEGLIPLMTSLYPELYPEGNPEYLKCLKHLETTPAPEWLAYAATKPYHFQEDGYAHSDHLYFADKPFRPRATVDLDCVAFAFQGKVFMEESARFLGLFTRLLKEKFPLPLAKALKVYTTG